MSYWESPITKTSKVERNGFDSMAMSRAEAELLDEQVLREAHLAAVAEAPQKILCRECNGAGKLINGGACANCHGTGDLPATQAQWELDELQTAADCLREDVLKRLEPMERYSTMFLLATWVYGRMISEIDRAKAEGRS